MDELSRLYDWFGEGGRLSRSGLVVAFGGGVVGDLAGFAAATWMRGVKFAQIPTTLLAMVDSSVGGKTAIDTGRGKNLVGAFHQPAVVVIDPALMASLPEREFGSGLAEVVKYGAVASEALFSRLEDHGGEFGVKGGATGRARAFPGDIIYECCAIKAGIVESDEFDAGRRMTLNFGHTFGHAIEAKYGFEKYNHGEAVAAGMYMAAVAGERLGVTEAGPAARIKALLENLGLFFHEDPDGLIDYMKSDKKAASGGVNLVLLTRVGEAVIRRVEWDELEEAVYGKDDR
jgi:3-dehydroquinate synthase